jgi:nucleotide-binding universal stress UspA family protein
MGEAATRAARHYLDGVAATLRTEDVAVESRAMLAGAGVAEAVMAAANDLDAAFVVLASHGYTGFDRWMLGSVADAVVRMSTRPVLVLRADPASAAGQDAEIRRVLVPLDGFAPAEEALPPAVAIARASGAALDLMHVLPGPYAFLAGVSPTIDEQMRRTAAIYMTRLRQGLPASLSTEQHVLTGSPAEQILQHAEQTGADLVVMSTHGRAGVARWALGSVADRVLRGGHLPVLLIRPQSSQRGPLFPAERDADR